MTYNFDTEVEVNFDFDVSSVYEQAVNAVLEYEKCPYEADVSLLITNDDSIREINKEMRGLDTATDVLSFPMSDYTNPADFSNIESDSDAFEPDSGELLLGDIVISLDKIISQADAFGHSTKREFAFLIVHSMLHLIGFDHIEESDRAVMEAHQKEIMNIINIQR